MLVSAGRTRRPWQGRVDTPAEAPIEPYDPSCYLCPGNERASGARNPRYERTFVFDNDFGALTSESAGWRFEQGLTVAESERGTCRVICFSPRHDLGLASMGGEQVRAVVDVWADQSDELGERYRWVQVFENRGELMGASNPHPHGQIWATGSLPREAAREDASQRRHLASTGRRLLLDYAAQEAGGPRAGGGDAAGGWSSFRSGRRGRTRRWSSRDSRCRVSATSARRRATTWPSCSCG